MSNTNQTDKILDIARDLDGATDDLLTMLERPATDWRSIHARHVDICRLRRDIRVGLEKLDILTDESPALTPYVRVALTEARATLEALR